VNATDAPVPAGLLHDGFVEQARLHGDRLAVVSGERRLSYAELEGRSRALAVELRAAGAAPNRLVAVVMDKGWEQVVAVLGITRAGGAYLPIDASLPAERIAQLLAAGQVELAVVQPAVEERLSWPAGIERIRIGADEPATDAAAELPAAGPEDLAYVIFTSGSTGVPKGVMIDHRGALNTVVDVNQRYAVGPEDRVLGLSALNFDLSVYDIFGLLAAGGALVLPDAAASRDPEAWAALVAAERVTIWNSVPALLEMMAHYAADRGAERLASLRVAMLSGDWIPVTLPDRIRALVPGLGVHSLGGATEASIWSITSPIGEVPPSWTSIPYGVPMLNQRFHVLDERMAPRPEWVPGQLFIGGIGVAKGYWQDAEKTGASFVTHPRTGERLYRTGDLGRYLPDGNIEFLGREDFQVKVQGHRIELGEIESVLEQHPAVRNGVAAAVGERNARRLVAYVTLKEAAPVAAPAVAAVPAPRHGEAAVRLARTLESLRQARLAELPLPKYGYPSAGNLYPVQAYVAVPAGTGGIGAGTYYYDPRGNRLVRVAPPLPAELAPGADGPAVFLVARLAAIAPVYGQLAPDFCLLEAGYMQVLLAESAAGQGLAAAPAAIASPEGVRRHLGLDEGHVPLQCLRLGSATEAAAGPVDGAVRTAWEAMSSWVAAQLASGAGAALGEMERLEFKLREPGLRAPRAGDVAVDLDPVSGRDPAADRGLLYRGSDREFLRDPIPLDTFRAFLGTLAEGPAAALAGAPTDGLAVALYLAAGAVEGLTPGGYRYDPRGGELSLVAPLEVLPPEAHAPVNRAAFGGSGFSLFLCAPPGRRDASLLLAGGVGQALMTAGPAVGIGLCAIGSMQFDPIRRVLGLDPDAVLLHSFVGGRVPPRARPAVRAAGEGQGTSAPAAAAVVDAAETAESVRKLLASRLPDYMVPKRIVVLDEFPLTPNGKVDRTALPQADELDAPEWTAPRTPIEERLGEIWRELLGVARVGVDDGFFALGGDSVKAIQFLARAREAGMEIAVRDFFQNPNIAALARLLSPGGAGAGGGEAAGGPAQAPLTPVVSDDELTQEELEQLIAEFGGFGDEGPLA
jgi:amino acid adenylation domain-containing protein